jgi:hypothetical protein
MIPIGKTSDGRSVEADFATVTSARHIKPVHRGVLCQIIRYWCETGVYELERCDNRVRLVLRRDEFSPFFA